MRVSRALGVADTRAGGACGQAVMAVNGIAYTHGGSLPKPVVDHLPQESGPPGCRPALAVVRPPARAGRRAVEFIQWAVDAYGSPSLDSRAVVIGRSQASLADDAGRSAGTVAGYLRELRDAGVVRGSRPIVVDTAALPGWSGEERLSDGPGVRRACGAGRPWRCRGLDGRRGERGRERSGPR